MADQAIQAQLAPRGRFSSRFAGQLAGIHFYTLNRSPATRALFEILQLTRPVR